MPTAKFDADIAAALAAIRQLGTALSGLDAKANQVSGVKAADKTTEALKREEKQLKAVKRATEEAMKAVAAPKSSSVKGISAEIRNALNAERKASKALADNPDVDKGERANLKGVIKLLQDKHKLLADNRELAFAELKASNRKKLSTAIKADQEELLGRRANLTRATLVTKDKLSENVTGRQLKVVDERKNAKLDVLKAEEAARDKRLEEDAAKARAKAFKAKQDYQEKLRRIDNEFQASRVRSQTRADDSIDSASRKARAKALRDAEKFDNDLSKVSDKGAAKRRQKALDTVVAIQAQTAKGDLKNAQAKTSLDQNVKATVAKQQAKVDASFLTHGDQQKTIGAKVNLAGAQAFTQHMRNSGKAVDTINIGLRNQGALITGSTRSLVSQNNVLKQQLANQGKSIAQQTAMLGILKQQNAAATKLGGSITLSALTFAKGAAFNAATSGIYALGAAFKSSVKDARELDIEIARIRTIDTSRSSQASVGNDVANISKTFGFDQLDVAKAEYNAISDQVVTAGNAQRFLADSAQFALAGVSSLTDAVKLSSSIYNAYQLNLSDVTLEQDKMFKAVEVGRFVIADIADSWGRTAALAHTLSISTTELDASLALMTRQGIKAHNANTLLRGVMEKVIQPTEAMAEATKKLGFSTPILAVKTLGLANFMSKLEENSQDAAASLGDLYSTQRAIVGASIFAGNEDQFKVITEQIDNAAGATKRAADIIQESFGQRAVRATNEFQVALTNQIGKPLLETLVKFNDANQVVGKFSDGLRFVSEHARELSGLIAGALAAAVTIYTVRVAAAATANYALSVSTTGVAAAQARQLLTTNALAAAQARLAASTNVMTTASAASGLTLARVGAFLTNLHPALKIGSVLLLGGAAAYSAYNSAAETTNNILEDQGALSDRLAKALEGLAPGMQQVSKDAIDMQNKLEKASKLSSAVTSEFENQLNRIAGSLGVEFSQQMGIVDEIMQGLIESYSNAPTSSPIATAMDNIKEAATAAKKAVTELNATQEKRTEKAAATKFAEAFNKSLDKKKFAADIELSIRKDIAKAKSPEELAKAVAKLDNLVKNVNTLKEKGPSAALKDANFATGKFTGNSATKPIIQEANIRALAESKTIEFARLVKARAATTGALAKSQENDVVKQRKADTGLIESGVGDLTGEAAKAQQAKIDEAKARQVAAAEELVRVTKEQVDAEDEAGKVGLKAARAEAASKVKAMEAAKARAEAAVERITRDKEIEDLVSSGADPAVIEALTNAAREQEAVQAKSLEAKRAEVDALDTKIKAVEADLRKTESNAVSSDESHKRYIAARDALTQVLRAQKSAEEANLAKDQARAAEKAEAETKANTRKVVNQTQAFAGVLNEATRLSSTREAIKSRGDDVEARGLNRPGFGKNEQAAGTMDEAIKAIRDNLEAVSKGADSKGVEAKNDAIAKQALADVKLAQAIEQAELGLKNSIAIGEKLVKDKAPASQIQDRTSLTNDQSAVVDSLKAQRDFLAASVSEDLTAQVTSMRDLTQALLAQGVDVTGATGGGNKALTEFTIASGSSSQIGKDVGSAVANELKNLITRVQVELSGVIKSDGTVTLKTVQETVAAAIRENNARPR